MNERNVYKVISSVEGVSNFHERETQSSAEDIVYYEFGFDFSDMKFFGTQITSPLFTLNRFNLLFRYTLKKETTKGNILEALNQYNLSRPLIKLVLTEMTGKKIEVKFSSDFISDDAMISGAQIVPIINIMAPSPGDFVTFLSKKKISLNHT
ncbi:hypothetical protein [Pseudomonas sp. K5002]|uniref:hypothetical protein n=1 Tax=Pseudomonas sp. K5002 TaxID=2738828 RepID=UPI0015BC599A|nr:hypothetical protein [Pseudomonas sp. K5002]NWD89915.1 hypothetical protein [Pseudomonas sp. K5002]